MSFPIYPTSAEMEMFLFPITDALHLVLRPHEYDTPPKSPRRCSGDALGLSARYGGPSNEGLETCQSDAGALYRSLCGHIRNTVPKTVFVYGTGHGGLRPDDVDGICARVEEESGVTVVPVHPKEVVKSGLDRGKEACLGLFQLMGTASPCTPLPYGINIFGASPENRDILALKNRCEAMGVAVLAVIPGHTSVEQIRNCHHASLNIVLGKGPLHHLAVMMEVEYGIPLVFHRGDLDGAVALIRGLFGEASPERKTDYRAAWASASGLWMAFALHQGWRLKTSDGPHVTDFENVTQGLEVPSLRSDCPPLNAL